eukprot:TRINITY_DN5499_c0_g2_i8.p1 TRINITY_DN5499_c0_g2~~TRINITY_DN5499_c0_g2_i8.p1  ORF type:complete len:449 (-),score=82.50 TRINITY_DN5499_c0_g2_i8:47-1393(-)
MFQVEVPCKTLALTPLDQVVREVQIQILKFFYMKNMINLRFEKVAGGIFSSSYVCYVILTTPFNWMVKRRFSDFYLLRSTLIKLYPGINIPPIPPKKTGRGFEEPFLLKRQIFLERFLRSCVDSPIIRNSPQFFNFMSVSDESSWKRIKSEMERAVEIKRIDDMWSPIGKITLVINNENKIFAQNAKEFVDFADPLYKRLRRLTKQLMVDYDKMSNTLYDMAESFSNLHKHISTFNDSIEVGKNKTLEDIYVTLNNMYVKWGDTCQEEIKLSQEQLRPFFKYRHHENNSFKELIRIRQYYGQEYIRHKMKVDQKKERLFQLGDISKWEMTPAQLQGLDKAEILKNKGEALKVMLPKETALEFQLRDQFAFYNQQNHTEVKRSFGYINTEYRNHFANLAKLQSNTLANIHVVWADLLANFSEAGAPLSKPSSIMERHPTLKQEEQSPKK